MLIQLKDRYTIQIHSMIIGNTPCKRYLNTMLLEMVRVFKFDMFVERTVYDEQSLLVQPFGNPNKLIVDISIKVPQT